MKEQYIKIKDVMDYCRESAKNLRELADKCIRSTGKGESETSSLGGAAYFLQRAEMFDFYIPDMIKNLDYEDFSSSKEPVELTPLEALGLSTKTYNCLKRADIKTLGDITNMYLFELKEIRNLGNKSFSEVMEALKKYGVSLKSEQYKHEHNNYDNWASVQEKLPSKNEYVIACFDDGFITGVEYTNDWELWADSGEVVAWMPLPKPYKGINNEK